MFKHLKCTPGCSDVTFVDLEQFWYITIFSNYVHAQKAYSEPCTTSKTELFAKIAGIKT